MIVASILKTKGGQVVAVRPEDSIATVCATLAQHRIGAVLVRDAGGAVLGILSERDVVRAVAASGDSCLQDPARQLMTRDVVSISPQTLVVEALSMMTERRLRHLPVLDSGRLAGMVSIGDLVKARIEEALHEAEELKSYVVSAG